MLARIGARRRIFSRICASCRCSAYYSNDDPYAQNNAIARRRVISYGMSEQAEGQVSHAGFCEERGMVIGMSANIVVGGEGGEICVKGSVGITQLLPLVLWSAAATAFEIPYPMRFRRSRRMSHHRPWLSLCW